MSLRGDANDAASGACTSVAGFLGLGVVGFAEVVGAAVDDDGALWLYGIVNEYSPKWLFLDVEGKDGGWEGERKEHTPMTLSEPISLTNLSVTLP